MMITNMGVGSHENGDLQPAWVNEQISLFSAAIGVKVHFVPAQMGVAGLVDGLSGFCGVCGSRDGHDQAACQRWHERQAPVIMQLTRAVRLRCPMELDYLCVPVSTEGAFYGFLYCVPVLQAGPPDGHGREKWGHRRLGNGSSEESEVASHKVPKLRRIHRVLADQSDGLVFLLELMGQRLGACFHQERHLPAPLDPNEALVKRAEAVLCGLYHEKISTRDIAEKLHVSESHLCHAFQHVTGGTLRQHLNELRFQEACRLLKEYQRLTVAEVAFAAGFQSLSRFSEQFRRRKLPSPGKWRQLQGGGE